MPRLDIIICLFCLLSFLYYHHASQEKEEGMIVMNEDQQLYELQKEDVLMKNKQSMLMLFEKTESMEDTLSKKMHQLLSYNIL
jgi:uncharacterized protein YbaR (Trm112 family)